MVQAYSQWEKTKKRMSTIFKNNSLESDRENGNFYVVERLRLRKQMGAEMARLLYQKSDRKDERVCNFTHVKINITGY